MGYASVEAISLYYFSLFFPSILKIEVNAYHQHFGYIDLCIDLSIYLSVLNDGQTDLSDRINVLDHV